MSKKKKVLFETSTATLVKIETLSYLINILFSGDYSHGLRKDFSST